MTSLLLLLFAAVMASLLVVTSQTTSFGCKSTMAVSSVVALASCSWTSTTSDDVIGFDDVFIEDMVTVRNGAIDILFDTLFVEIHYGRRNIHLCFERCRLKIGPKRRIC